MDAGGELNAVAVAPQGDAIASVQYTRFPSPTTDDDCDDLYGDFNLGFLPLPPLSPSPSSPPKTPSPGLFLPSPSPTPSPSPSPSPSPPPRRTPSPKPQSEPEPEPEPQPNPTPQHQPPPKSPTPQHQPPPKSPTPQHQPPFPAPKQPSPRHQPPLSTPKALTWRLQLPKRAAGRSASSPPPAAAALYIGDLPWWTTDAEVEAALAPHGELRALHFFADKSTGKSRGHCRAEFQHPAAAASAAAALHGRAFDGHHCVASLSRPPGLHRPDADFDASAPAPAPNPTLGRGGNVATARGNVGFLGDGSAPGPMASRPRAFGAMIGDGGGFPSAGAGQCGPMPPMVASHVNPAFLAARMAMGGTGTAPWHNQGMAGDFWGGQQPWNFGGCEMPWQQQQGLQQQYQNGDYGNGTMRSTRRERPGRRNEDRDIGNVRGNQDRRQYGRGGGARPRERNRGERNYDNRDRRGGEKRRYEEYTERDDWQRRGRARSSQSRNSDDDDNPRQQSRGSDDDDYPRRRR